MALQATSRRILIAAPSARDAIALERRLAYFRPVATGHGSEWQVELEDFEDEVGELTVAVEYWLREIGASSTEMNVDGAPVTVGTPATGDAPLGSGYDGFPVLEHEP